MLKFTLREDSWERWLRFGVFVVETMVASFQCLALFILGYGR